MTCRLCHSTNKRTLFKVNDFSITRCSDCNLLYVLETPTPDQLKALYTKKFFERGKYNEDKMNIAAQKENQRRLAIVNKHLRTKENCKVLDYGCAYGDFVHFLNDHYDAYGTDISEDALKTAEEKYPHLNGKFFGLDDTEDKKFDAIFLWDVIEHVADPIQTMEDLKKILKPGGKIFISTPNVDTAAFHLFKKSWAFMIPPEHLSFFGPKTLNQLFEKTGFVREDSKSMGKWVNVAFLGYKLKKAFPKIIPNALVSLMQNSFIHRFNIYIPTGDIQYVSARFKGEVA